ncbi:hypothetical protein ACOSQ2_021068 [Xanthoceras sorbifolium]
MFLNRAFTLSPSLLRAREITSQRSVNLLRLHQLRLSKPELPSRIELTKRPGLTSRRLNRILFRLHRLWLSRTEPSRAILSSRNEPTNRTKLTCRRHNKTLHRLPQLQLSKESERVLHFRVKNGGTWIHS